MFPGSTYPLNASSDDRARGGISQHGFRQDPNGSEVPQFGKRYRLESRSGRDSHRPDQLSQRSFPRPQKGPSQPSWLIEDGRQTTSPAQLPEADGRRELPSSRSRTGTPVLIGMGHTRT